MRARTRLRSAMLLAATALVLSCGAAPTGWRTIITDHDRSRLHNWRDSWLAAVAKARRGGAGAHIDTEGSLLQPDTSIDGPQPADGDYHCRIVKVGSQTPSGLDFVTYPGSRCRIAKGHFTKLDGAQRPVGRLYPYDGAHMLFLGSMALGDEAGAMAYGSDPDRDMVGLIDRIGPRRWRLVLPSPRWESMLDVVELTPIAN